jgi:hypothetical protein
MNDWRSRVLLCAALVAGMIVHSVFMSAVANTNLGMFEFHASAACFDLMLLKSAPRLIGGRLCGDMQALFLASIIANFVGWIAYTAYAPPIYYNGFMWLLTYVQWARLLLVDRNGADYLGFDLVCGFNSGRDQNYFRKEVA